MDNLPSTGFVVAKFWASYCPPCKLLSSSIWPRILEEYPDVNFIDIETDKEQQLTIDNKIVVIPTVLFIKDGQELYRIVGMQQLKTYEDAINKYSIS